MVQPAQWLIRACDGPSNSRGMKMPDMKMQDLIMLDTKIGGIKQLLTGSEVTG